MGDLIKLQSHKLDLDDLSVNELIALQTELMQDCADSMDLVNELMSEHTRTLRKVSQIISQIDRLNREKVPF